MPLWLVQQIRNINAKCTLHRWIALVQGTLLAILRVEQHQPMHALIQPGRGNVFAFVARSVVWHGLLRSAIFMSLVYGSWWVLSRVTPFSDVHVLRSVVQDALAGSYDRLSSRDFAFALASLVVQAAGALAVAFLIAHVVLVRLAIAVARRQVRRLRGVSDFAVGYSDLTRMLERNAVIGHAWGEFAETLVPDERAVRNTVRPQSFINIGAAREQFAGLKMMNAIPGYFVGLGLLFTFIGLVFALNKAAASTGAGSAEAMTHSLNELLSAATFKFGTSIAGLGSSLVLSLLFKVYTITIEPALMACAGTSKRGSSSTRRRRSRPRRRSFWRPSAISSRRSTASGSSRGSARASHRASSRR